MCSVSLSPRGRLFLIGMLIVFILTGPPGLRGHQLYSLWDCTGHRQQSQLSMWVMVQFCSHFWPFSVHGESLMCNPTHKITEEHRVYIWIRVIIRDVIRVVRAG